MNERSRELYKEWILSNIAYRDSIRTYFANLHKGFSNIILDFGDAWITIPYINAYYFSPLLIGDTINLHIQLAGKDYLIKCSVLEIRMMDLPETKLQVENVIILDEQRTSRRIDIDLMGYLLLKDDLMEAVLIENISSEGFSLISRKDLSIGEPVNIAVCLSDDLVSIKARVLWKKMTNSGKSQYGLSISADVDREKLCAIGNISEIEHNISIDQLRNMYF